MVKLDATLETRISKKNNTEYKVLVIKFPCGYKKNVFLEEAELKLLEMSSNVDNSIDSDFMPDLR